MMMVKFKEINKQLPVTFYVTGSYSFQDDKNVTKHVRPQVACTSPSGIQTCTFPSGIPKWHQIISKIHI